MTPQLLPSWCAPRVSQRSQHLTSRTAAIRHLLILLPAGENWFDAPDTVVLQDVLARKGKTGTDLAKQALATELPGGCLAVCLRLDPNRDAFDWHTRLRQALKPLLDEHPAALDISCHGPTDFCARAALAALRVAGLNGGVLPTWKSEKPGTALARITVHGTSRLSLDPVWAQVEASVLCRHLTLLPPNILTPASYRQAVASLAREEGWKLEEYDIKRLKKLKAGAFLAVARGSGHEDAAILRLSYKGQATKSKGTSSKGTTIALVGKGICFDTGGHNLKPARYMNNMHDDMNGSAVALGLLLGASRMKLPVNLEVWLAIAQNHLSPEAYTQNEVVTALNGTTIEIVHTDAEGRMVLADTLALAAREKPAAILDFATLTGSMAVALGDRMSGVISNRPELLEQATRAAQASGERVVAFPMPADYDEALDSPVADVKQCTLDGEADHVLAARFLQRFVDDVPWLHMDLSASRCKGGLGAAGSDITGFGVAWGLEMLPILGQKPARA